MDDTQLLEVTKDNSIDLEEYQNRILIGWLKFGNIQHELHEGKIKIGRDPSSCDIILENEKTVSKEHAAVEAELSSVFLMDLGSLNKTKLRKKALKPFVQYALFGGETIYFGSVKAVFIVNAQETVVDEAVNTPINTSEGTLSCCTSKDFVPETPHIRNQNLSNGSILVEESPEKVSTSLASLSPVQNTNDSDASTDIEDLIANSDLQVTQKFSPECDEKSVGNTTQDVLEAFKSPEKVYSKDILDAFDHCNTQDVFEAFKSPEKVHSKAILETFHHCNTQLETTQDTASSHCNRSPTLPKFLLLSPPAAKADEQNHSYQSAEGSEGNIHEACTQLFIDEVKDDALNGTHDAHSNEEKQVFEISATHLHAEPTQTFEALEIQLLDNMEHRPKTVFDADHKSNGGDDNDSNFSDNLLSDDEENEVTQRFPTLSPVGGLLVEGCSKGTEIPNKTEDEDVESTTENQVDCEKVDSSTGCSSDESTDIEELLKCHATEVSSTKNKWNLLSRNEKCSEGNESLAVEPSENVQAPIPIDNEETDTPCLSYSCFQLPSQLDCDLSSAVSVKLSSETLNDANSDNSLIEGSQSLFSPAKIECESSETVQHIELKSCTYNENYFPSVKSDMCIEDSSDRRHNDSCLSTRPVQGLQRDQIIKYTEEITGNSCSTPSAHSSRKPRKSQEAKDCDPEVRFLGQKTGRRNRFAVEAGKGEPQKNVCTTRLGRLTKVPRRFSPDSNISPRNVSAIEVQLEERVGKRKLLSEKMDTSKLGTRKRRVNISRPKTKTLKRGFHSLQMEEAPPGRSLTRLSEEIVESPVRRLTIESEDLVQAPSVRRVPKQSEEMEEAPHVRKLTRQAEETEKSPPCRRFTRQSKELEEAPAIKMLTREAEETEKFPPGRRLTKQSKEVQEAHTIKRLSRQAEETENFPLGRRITRQSKEVEEAPTVKRLTRKAEETEKFPPGRRLTRQSEEGVKSHPVRRVTRQSYEEVEEFDSKRISKGACKMLSPRPEEHLVYWPPFQTKTLPSKYLRILFTGFQEKEEMLIHELGGHVVASAQECNVLVANSLGRTCKLMACVAKGIPVVSVDWLPASKEAGYFVDPWRYIIVDSNAEAKFGFKLKRSLIKASKKKLFAGFSFHVTPSVQPPPEQIREILECAGAGYLVTPPTGYSEWNIIISCTKDKARWPMFRKFQLPIFDVEFVLTGLLKQEIDTQKYIIQ